MQIKPSFVLLATLASVGTISALPVDGTAQLAEREAVDVDARGDGGIEVLDHQARDFYDELDVREVFDELETREFDDLEVRDFDELEVRESGDFEAREYEGLEARARGGRAKPGPKPPKPGPKPDPKPSTPRPGIEISPSIPIPLDPLTWFGPGQQQPPPAPAVQRRRLGGRPKPNSKPAPKPPVKPPAPGTQPGRPGIEISPGISIPIDPFQWMGQPPPPAAPVARDLENRARGRGGRPGPGSKPPASKPDTKPGSGRPGIEFNPSIGIPLDPFQILNPGLPAPPPPAPAVQRRARGGRPGSAPKPAPKPAPNGKPVPKPPTTGPKPPPQGPKPPGGGPHVNPPTIGIEPVIPLPPLFPPAPPAPGPTSTAAAAAPTQ